MLIIVVEIYSSRLIVQNPFDVWLEYIRAKICLKRLPSCRSLKPDLIRNQAGEKEQMTLYDADQFVLTGANNLNRILISST